LGGSGSIEAAACSPGMPDMCDGDRVAARVVPSGPSVPGGHACAGSSIPEAPEAEPSGPRSTGRSTVSATSTAQEGNVAAPTTRYAYQPRRGVVASSPRRRSRIRALPGLLPPARRAPANRATLSRRPTSGTATSSWPSSSGLVEPSGPTLPGDAGSSVRTRAPGASRRRSWAVACPRSADPWRSSHPRPVSRDGDRRSSSSGHWPGSRILGVTATHRRRSAAP
jgi:hypothetical protein